MSKRHCPQCPARPLSSHQSKPPTLTLRVCPYAQRIIIALAEKGIDYTPVELAVKNAAGQWAIPLGADKPAWFTQYNPEGKV